MIPIVDARSGQVVAVGKMFTTGDEVWMLNKVHVGLFSARVEATVWGHGEFRAIEFKAPVKWWPHFVYKDFPVKAARVVLLPT